MRPPLATLGRALGFAALLLAVASPALAQRTVTLRMNSATMPDTLRADQMLAGAQIRGGLESGTTTLPSGQTIDWGSGTTLLPTNVGGDYWETTFQIPNNDKLSFKHYFQQSEDAGIGGWEDDADGTGGNDYVIAAGEGDVSLDLHYFNKSGSRQTFDWRPFAAEGDAIAVWFRVYMLTTDAVGRGYDRADEGLVVGMRGNFGTLGASDADGPVTDWGDGTEDEQIAVLTRERGADDTKPGYDLFSGLVTYPASAAGQGAAYKFYFKDSNSTGDGGYEGADNRGFTVPAAGTDTTLHWVFYGDSPATDPPDNANEVERTKIFRVDVSPLNDVGLFATSDDDIQIRGDFIPTDWGNCADADPPTDDCALTRTPGQLIYNTSQTFTDEPGDVRQYKYFVDFNNPDDTPQFVDGEDNEIILGWEEPLDYGGGNRRYTFTDEENQIVGPEFFNSIRGGNVIGDGVSVDVVFSVDMARAMAFTGDRQFDPAADSVTVQFEDPLWLITQGYEAVDDRITVLNNNRLINGFKLTDPDEDLVYTGTLTVTGPTYNAVAYRYLFANDADGAYVEGSGGEGEEGRRRYRYITDTSARTAGRVAFTFALDGFRSTDEDTPWELNPTGSFTADDFDNGIAPGAADPVTQGTANADGPGRDGALVLGPVFPNPTTGMARMALGVPAGEAVAVRVFDVTGRQVATVFEGPLGSARTLDIDTRGWAAGVYVVRAEAASGVATRTLTVVR